MKLFIFNVLGITIISYFILISFARALYVLSESYEGRFLAGMLFFLISIVHFLVILGVIFD